MKFEKSESRDRPVGTSEELGSDGSPQTDPGSREVRERGAGVFFGTTARPSMRPFAQFGPSLAVAVGVLVFVIHESLLSGSRNSGSAVVDTSRMRPVAFTAEEIFLPRSLIDVARDETLHRILRDRSVDRLDAYLDAHGLRNSWYLIRYRGTDSDGATWKGMTTNFECKRYHVHGAMVGLVENKLANLEVLARALARAVGRQPDPIVMADKHDEAIVFITHYDEARIVPIPDEATDLRFIGRDQIDAWRKRAGMDSP